MLSEDLHYQKKYDAVCIVGCAESKIYTPFDRPETEFWGVNNLFASEQIPGAHWDRWFEIHQIKRDAEKLWRRVKVDHKNGAFQWGDTFRGLPMKEYAIGLSKLDCPVYMVQTWPEIPNSVLFPWQKIVECVGNYITNTISWQIAFAIMLDFKEIMIYGVDMAVGSEYAYQRPSCEWMLGIAAGRGIAITIPPQADLLKSRFLYAIEEKEQDLYTQKLESIRKGMLIRQNKIAGEIEALQKQLAEKTAELNQYAGGVHAIVETTKIWSNLGDKI